MKNKNENAEHYKQFSTCSDSKVFLDVEQMTLVSDFLNAALKEKGSDISWIKYAMGNGSHSSKYMGKVFGEAAESRASQWLFLANRVFWRLKLVSKMALLGQYLKLLSSLAFPKRERPVKRVTKDTEPKVVQRRRIEVKAQRNNRRHLTVLENTILNSASELEK